MTAAEQRNGYTVAETRALLEMGVRNHGWYLIEAEHAGILAVFDALLAERDAAVAALEARDGILARWLAHYPETVFPPIPAEKLAEVVRAIEATGITSDALRAAWARHILSHVMRAIQEADTLAAAAAVTGRNTP